MRSPVMDEDLLLEGFEGMRNHRRFLAAERTRMLAIADQIDAGLAAAQRELRREIERHRRLLALIESDRSLASSLGTEGGVS